MLQNKIMKTMLPIALIGTILLAGCAKDQNVPGEAPGINEVTKPAPKNPNKTSKPEVPKEEDYRDVDKDTGIPEVKEGDIVEVKERESEQQASIFFEENLFGINPSSILVPNDVKETFSENKPENIPNTVLAMLSDSSSKSVLQDVTTENNKDERAMLLQSFADMWLSDSATETFYRATDAYLSGEEKNHQDIFSLISTTPPSNKYNAAGTIVESIKSDTAWETTVDGLEILGVHNTKDSISPMVKVQYNKTTFVPVSGNQLIPIKFHITIFLEPGLNNGDWLIVNYEDKIITKESE